MKTTFYTIALILGILSCNSSTHPEQVVDQKKVIQLQVSELEGFTKLSNTIFLDVRTPEEFQEGYIPNAIHLNYYDDTFESKLKALERSNTYVVYCKSGFRSQNAAQKMIDLGFKEVYNLVGGYDAWKK